MLGPDATENGHTLQEFDPRVMHGRHFLNCRKYDFRGSVGKE